MWSATLSDVSDPCCCRQRCGTGFLTKIENARNLLPTDLLSTLLEDLENEKMAWFQCVVGK